MSMRLSQLKFHYASAFKNVNRKTWWSGTRCHSHSDALPNNKKSWWMVILLSNEEKFCPWSLMIKECPFLSFFLVLLRFCRGFWCSYHWPEQAVKCSACLGRAINCVMTYMSLEEGSFHSSVVVLLKPTLKHCGKLEKN